MKTKAENEGRKAFRKGLKQTACLYGNKDGGKRVEWLGGWLSERTNKRLGHIWERNGMKGL